MIRQCPYYDCGWCYKETSQDTNAGRDNGCRSPRECPTLIELTEEEEDNEYT